MPASITNRPASALMNVTAAMCIVEKPSRVSSAIAFAATNAGYHASDVPAVQ